MINDRGRNSWFSGQSSNQEEVTIELYPEK